mmetsp:Transcript_13567/g.15763  ORF Transcript_13567/g.15763 Transcript_13567/m.15763 type:complete len:91 (+) Transcript_13567:265-537(+)
MQIALLFFFGALVYMSELINAYCAVHWKKFSSQNYFDKHGVFTGLFWAAPLLILMMFQMLNALYQSSNMLVEVKVAELKEKRKQKKKKEN